MNPFASLVSIVAVLATVHPAAAQMAEAQPSDSSPATKSEPASGHVTVELFNTIAALDTAVFDTFNRCGSPQQLQKHATYFAPDLEFYHDLGGVTWMRQEYISDVEKNICGKIRRELIPGSLEVFPIEGFGAIARGEHRFCQLATGDCQGMADFLLVWRQKDNEWQITRALSYAHRPLD